MHRANTADPLIPWASLTVIALTMLVIYLTYATAFPLVPHTREAVGPAADLEMLMRGSRWFAGVYVAGLVLLFGLFWQALRLLRPLDGRAAKLLVVGFGLSFALGLMWLYPITANDLFRYVVRGRVWAVHGENPLQVPPAAIASDPYTAFAGEYANSPSVYGPLWELTVQIPLRLGAEDMVSGSLGLKIIVILCYLACCGLLGWLANVPNQTVSLAFFAWNPLVLMQGPGNGHNDLLFMALMLAGLIAWHRRAWAITALLLVLATLAKASALLLLPLFGVALLRTEATWPRRLLKMGLVGGIALLTTYLVYLPFGPVLANLDGLGDTLVGRRGFAIAAAVRMTLREVLTPGQASDLVPRTTARYIFIAFYGWLVWRLWQGRLTLVTAGFLAYFAQLMLGGTFRIWYPLWLVPLAALHLTPLTLGTTLVFGLTAELSIINYFVVWRWYLRDWQWENWGLLAPTGYYWPIMHWLTVPWVFGLPLLIPVLLARRRASVSSEK